MHLPTVYKVTDAFGYENCIFVRRVFLKNIYIYLKYAQIIFYTKLLISVSLNRIRFGKKRLLVVCMLVLNLT